MSFFTKINKVFNKWILLLSGLLILKEITTILFRDFIESTSISFLSNLKIEYSIILIIISIIVSAFLVNKEQTQEDKPNSISRDSTKKEKLLPLPKIFNLDSISDGVIKWNFYINRYCLPNINLPNIDDFVLNILISDGNCSICDSEIEKGITLESQPMMIKFVHCPLITCVNHKKYKTEYDFGNKKNQGELEFISKVKHDFKKYWSKYKQIYDEHTDGGHYDRYIPPIKIRKSYKYS